MNGVEGYSGYFRSPGAERIADRILTRLDADRSGGLSPEEVAGSKLEKRIGDRNAEVDGKASGDISEAERRGVAASRGAETAVAPGQSQVAAVLESILAELQANAPGPDAATTDGGGTTESFGLADEVRADDDADTARREAAETAAATTEEPSPRENAGSAPPQTSEPLERAGSSGPSSSTLTDLAQALYSNVQTLFDEVN